MPGRMQRGISRFIVMAMLQAARAKRLGLPTESAYSWGLNRAIFYAAAKAGFKGGSGSEGAGAAAAGTGSREPYQLADEPAFRDPRAPRLYFTIGSETQTEKDFERQIIARFGGAAHFEAAWKEAESVIESADPDDLRTGAGFYSRVYRPRRDELRDRWSAMIGLPPTGGGTKPRRRTG